MNNHREDASPAIYLKEWANDIDANSGGHSADAAKLRSIAGTIDGLNATLKAVLDMLHRSDFTPSQLYYLGERVEAVLGLSENLPILEPVSPLKTEQNEQRHMTSKPLSNAAKRLILGQDTLSCTGPVFTGNGLECGCAKCQARSMNNHREDVEGLVEHARVCAKLNAPINYLTGAKMADALEVLTEQVTALQRELDTLRHASVLALDFILNRQGNDAAETVVVADLRSALNERKQES